jgi:hypothetical protein
VSLNKISIASIIENIGNNKLVICAKYIAEGMFSIYEPQALSVILILNAQLEVAMLLKYETVKDNPALLQALTSLTPEEFEAVLPTFSREWEAYHATTLRPAAERQRRPGGGRKATLQTATDKLLFILFYYKLYPLELVLGFLFGMRQSQACEWIHKLSPVLQRTLAQHGYLPERDAPQVAVALEADGERTFAIDGVERRRQRPSDPEEQKTFYSGKKKAHTFKNNLIVSVRSRLVYYLGATHAGKKQEKAICDEEQPPFPEGSTLYQDKGFQGYAPAGVTIRQPKKKPRGGQLTPEEKQQNALISRLRIVVEHVIAGVKRCRIVKDVFRNTTDGFDDLALEIACGLHNLRTAYRT